MDEWADKKIDVTEFRAVKQRYEKMNISLIWEKAQLEDGENQAKMIRGVVDYLKAFDANYLRVTTDLKKIMLGSILAEKLIFEENDFRTPKYTPTVEVISQRNNELQEIKNGIESQI